MQITESSKREASLRQANEQLKDCLAQVSNDKQHVLDMINGNETDEKLRQRENELKELLR